MSKIGLRVRIEAKPEHAEAVAALLRSALTLAEQEELTVSWFAFRESETVFGVFDTFDGEDGREAHLNGRIANALLEIVPTHLAAAPEIKKVDLLAVKRG
ncbi:quinol monooxygenase YgiN [Kitasatospora sp. MAP12-15]|uniref:putative quinol monooxygenase n=1 Tax=unclassified Kitasatospora TaxID=2633591 RepID=UPI0024770554|nr:antibiotic biosynthesis monooxygenase [Kitasatospora sp. MAP12-44]MDH6114509.1 quinol monooxygenase YgiN [Kitasatospora sp. MAP12-44]